jgi:hypothetical protein
MPISNLAIIHENKKSSKIFCDQGRISTLQVTEPLPPLPSLPPLSDPRLLWACTWWPGRRSLQVKNYKLQRFSRINIINCNFFKLMVMWFGTEPCPAENDHGNYFQLKNLWSNHIVHTFDHHTPSLGVWWTLSFRWWALGQEPGRQGSTIHGPSLLSTSKLYFNKKLHQKISLPVTPWLKPWRPIYKTFGRMLRKYPKVSWS